MREPQLAMRERSAMTTPDSAADRPPVDGDRYRLMVDQSIDVLFHMVDDVVEEISPANDSS